MDEAWLIDTFPAGATLVEIDGMRMEWRMPDGSTQFITVIPDNTGQSMFKVVKTIFPVDAPIEISVGSAKEWSK